MFKGSIVAVVTPFNDDLSVNYNKLEELLNWHVENKTDGIVVMGTTGESPTLSKEEKLLIFEFTVKVINKRIPVIAGTGSNDTLASVAFSKEVEALGVDGLLIVTPYYNKANRKGFITHFEMIADSVKIPLIIYNVPSRTGVTLSVDVIKELSLHKNIIGVKEASGNISYVALIAAAVAKDFLIFSGNDDMVIPVLSLGGVGVISVAANVIPKQFHDMVELYLNGNIKEALKIQLGYLEFINNLFIETNPIPVKEFMNQLGHNVGGYRLPLCEIGEDNKQIVADTVRKYF